MAQLILAFQSELFSKIQLRASSKVSMDAFLFKSFKFFDLNSNGWLTKSDFFKAIAKCGIVVQTHNIDTIYQHYVAEDGKIYYRKFIQQLLFREDEIESNASRLKHSTKIDKSQAQDNKSETRSRKEEGGQQRQKLAQSKIMHLYNKCETYQEVLAFIKRSIDGKGLGSLLSIAVQLKATDTKKNHLVTKKTLKSIINDLPEECLKLIYQELSSNDTQIDYSVLVYDLKGQTEEGLTKEIQNVFNFLDDRREGEFPINYLVSKFLSRSKLEQFKKAVDLYVKFQGIDDGVFTEDDFNDFMGFISFDFASREQFQKQMIRTFYEEDNRSVTSQKSNRSRDFQANQHQNREEIKSSYGDFRKNKQQEQVLEKSSNKGHFQHLHEDDHQDDKKSVSRYSEIAKKQSDLHLNDVQSIVLRIKKRLATKGTKGFLLLERALKNADKDRDTLLSFDQFKQVILQQRIDITNKECNSIFDVFDEQGSEMISFPEFMFTLRGKMPEVRKTLTDKLWNQIKSADDTTNFAQIKHSLNFRNHPDVQSGRKYEDDLWREMQETIFTIQQLNGATRSDSVSRMEFEEYIQNFSLSILDDKLFEYIIINFWKLNTTHNIQDKYAGSRKLHDPTKNSYLMDHHRQTVQGGSVSQNAPFGTSVQPTSYRTEHHKL